MHGANALVSVLHLGWPLNLFNFSVKSTVLVKAKYHRVTIVQARYSHSSEATLVILVSMMMWLMLALAPVVMVLLVPVVMLSLVMVPLVTLWMSPKVRGISVFLEKKT